jgi:hypothetical protein
LLYKFVFFNEIGQTFSQVNPMRFSRTWWGKYKIIHAGTRLTIIHHGRLCHEENALCLILFCISFAVVRNGYGKNSPTSKIQAIMDATKTITGLSAGQKYYWRIQPRSNTWGYWSYLYSDIWNFTTMAAAPSAPQTGFTAKWNAVADHFSETRKLLLLK